jgi:hypothetical protein
LDPPLNKGVVTLRRNTTNRAGSIADQFASSDFFAVSCFLPFLNATGIAHDFSWCDVNSIPELALWASNSKPVPSIWYPVDALGKAMWFGVLADLGRDDDDMPNMLARPELLAQLSANLTHYNQTLRNAFRWAIEEAQPFDHTFDPTHDDSVRLGVNASVLTADYVCQIPQLKPPGTLFVSVLVADLVFLQAIWKIFTLIVSGWFIKSTEEAESCATCKLVGESEECGTELRKYVSVSQQEIPAESISTEHPSR